MIDAIQTLKNLNKKFPRFQLETLLAIVDCYAEESKPSSLLYFKEGKHHINDKTSSRLKILTKGE